jgi:hypothetical protein
MILIFLKIYMGYGYMSIFYSMVVKGTLKNNILLYGAKIWKDSAFKFKGHTILAT